MSEFEEEAQNRHERFERGMATRPDPALVLPMLEAPADHRRESVDGWTVVHVSKTPRQAVVLLEREVEEEAGVYSEYIFERSKGGGG